MYKYWIFSQNKISSNSKLPPPTHSIEELEMGGHIHSIRSSYTLKTLTSEIINTVKVKNDNNEALSDTQAIDLILIFNIQHEHVIKELMEITSYILVNELMPVREFRIALMTCQKIKIFQKR